MKFLIAGLGSIGRRHLRNLRALGQEDVVLYRTHQATLPDAELGELPTFTELSLALDEKPDGVIIANPTALHLDVAIAAAKAGSALLIEKPISDRLAGLGELQSVLNLSGKPAMVGFHFRFHPVLNQVKALLESRSTWSASLSSRPLGRISAGLASLGRLPPILRCPRGPWRGCGEHAFTPFGLFALVAGRSRKRQRLDWQTE